MKLLISVLFVLFTAIGQLQAVNQINKDLYSGNTDTHANHQTFSSDSYDAISVIRSAHSDLDFGNDAVSTFENEEEEDESEFNRIALPIHKCSIQETPEIHFFKESFVLAGISPVTNSSFYCIQYCIFRI